MTKEEMVTRIIGAIERWDEGVQFKARRVNDGGGHIVSLGVKVTEHGRDALMNVLEEIEADQRRHAMEPAR